MPELPEVENLARGLAARISGARIADIRFHSPAAAGVVLPGPERFTAGVRGRGIQGLHRHGKYLFFLLEGQAVVALHLRMTGQLLLVPRKHPADKHTHLDLLLKGRQTKLVFRDVRRFGRLKLLHGTVEQFVAEKRLGADALAISTSRLYELFQRTARCIKAVLLDQRVLAGLGNIYVDEILFREGISPSRRASLLSPDEVASLRRSIRAVLRSAIRMKGTTISDYVDAGGRRGGYQDSLLVYSRAGKPCPRCGTTILKSRIAGRGTYTCPSCQSC
jgi:formamidopyrimidine-DNA glycosylase